MNNYPYISGELMNGKTIYIESYDCYLGTITKEGSYNEEEVFNSEYESHNRDIIELLINLENNIKEEKSDVKKLIKIGDGYRLGKN